MVVGYQHIQSGTRRSCGSLRSPRVCPSADFLTFQSDLLNQLWLPAQLSSFFGGAMGMEWLPGVALGEKVQRLENSL